MSKVAVRKNLNRWFKEKWVDVSRKDPKTGKHPPCGRKKAKKGSKGYPKCRPSVKVSSKTPKTSGEMTSGQKRAATKRKRSKKQGVGGKPTVVKSVLILKNPVSPEAKRHKLEYDKEYESTPERVKYRSELRRERRRRGIDGKGGPDMSHTKDRTLVAEDPHTNRARHFKERGTLKGDPMDITWSFLKSDEADYNLYFGRPNNPTAGHYDPLSDTVNVNLGSILPTGRSMGFYDEDADKYTANVLSRINAHEFGHAVTDGQPGVGNLRLSDYGPYSRDLSATARIEHPANILQYPESALVAHRELLNDLNAHQFQNDGSKARLAAMFNQRVGEDHPMRGITGIMQQLDAPNRASVGRDGKMTFHTNTMTPQQKEQRFREIMGVRARSPGLRQANKFRTPEEYDRLIAVERRKDKQRRKA